jgi:hypothetical protein
VAQHLPLGKGFIGICDETFGIGIDLRTEINAKDYQVPFAFDGTINKLTVKLGPSQLVAAADKKAAAEAVAKAKD